MARTYIRSHINYFMQGQHCFNAFVWHLPDEDAAVSAAGAALVTVPVLWDNGLQDLLHTTVQMLNIETRMGNETAPEQIWDTILEEFAEGGATSECMPAWDTVTIRRLPDNTTLFPGTADPFLKSSYKTGISGIPEDQCREGHLTTAAHADWEAFAESLETITYNGDDYHLMIARAAPPGGSGAWVQVLETQVNQRLGTQLTRKY
jgi:hypothetical protein